jgi:CRP-like cAMP-binding protein
MAGQKDILDKIRSNCDFFYEFSDSQMLTMMRLVSLEKHRKGGNVFQKGDPADSFYVIIEGAVEIYVIRDHARQTLATLNDGQVFGEMGILYGHSRNASAVSLGETQLFNISEKLFTKNPSDFELLLKIYKGLARIVSKRAGDLIRKQRDEFNGMT